MADILPTSVIPSVVDITFVFPPEDAVFPPVVPGVPPVLGAWLLAAGALAYPLIMIGTVDEFIKDAADELLALLLLADELLDELEELLLLLLVGVGVGVGDGFDVDDDVVVVDELLLLVELELVEELLDELLGEFGV